MLGDHRLHGDDLDSGATSHKSRRQGAYLNLCAAHPKSSDDESNAHRWLPLRCCKRTSDLEGHPADQSSQSVGVKSVSGTIELWAWKIIHYMEHRVDTAVLSKSLVPHHRSLDRLIESR